MLDVAEVLDPHLHVIRSTMSLILVKQLSKTEWLCLIMVKSVGRQKSTSGINMLQMLLKVLRNCILYTNHMW